MPEKQCSLFLNQLPVMAMNLKVIPSQHGCVFCLFVCLFCFLGQLHKAGENSGSWAINRFIYVIMCLPSTLQRSDWLLYLWISLFPHPSSLPHAPPFSGIPFFVTFLHPSFLSPSSSSSCIGNFLIFHLLWATTTYLDALSYSILITTLSSRYWLRSHFLVERLD